VAVMGAMVTEFRTAIAESRVMMSTGRRLSGAYQNSFLRALPEKPAGGPQDAGDILPCYSLRTQ
jgi:hypothetical protein